MLRDLIVKMERSFEQVVSNEFQYYAKHIIPTLSTSGFWGFQESFHESLYL